MDSAVSGTEGKRKKTRRRLIALAAGLAFALLCGEGLLRFLLFSDSKLARNLGQRWRRMELYVDTTDADYWKLQSLFNRDEVSEPPTPDPLVGWTGNIKPLTYEHLDERLLAGRTPILFYGDSNAECRTGPEDCFQGLMERSEFANQYALLNYGVGGYGLDQIQRLLSASIDRFADKHPVVVVSFMVDDDLERSMLPFRCWAKPRYELRDGKLVDPGPVDTDPAHYLAEHPPSIVSYLYRLARGMWRPFDYERIRSDAEMAERRALNRAVLERIRDDLESRKLRYFFLVWQMESSFGRSTCSIWSQQVVDEFMAAHHVPYVPTRPFIIAATGSEGAGLGDLIGRDDPVLQNHMNPAGNRLVFEAIRQGLEGRFDAFDFERVRRMAAEGQFTPEQNLARTLTVLGLTAGYEGKSDKPCVRYKPEEPGHDLPRIAMRAGDDGRTRVEIDLVGRTQRFRARVRAVGAGDAVCKEGTMRLSARADANPWTTESFTIGDTARDWTVETTGMQKLELRLEYAGSDPACAWLLMDELRRE